MVIYEILSGDVPFDGAEATAAGILPELPAFCEELAKGKRPPIPALVAEDPDLKWIVNMVSWSVRVGQDWTAISFVCFNIMYLFVESSGCL